MVPAALAIAFLYLSCLDLSNWSFVYGSVTERVRKNVLAFETVAGVCDVILNETMMVSGQGWERLMQC